MAQTRKRWEWFGLLIGVASGCGAAKTPAPDDIRNTTRRAADSGGGRAPDVTDGGTSKDAGAPPSHAPDAGSTGANGTGLPDAGLSNTGHPNTSATSPSNPNPSNPNPGNPNPSNSRPGTVLIDSYPDSGTEPRADDTSSTFTQTQGDTLTSDVSPPDGDGGTATSESAGTTSEPPSAFDSGNTMPTSAEGCADLPQVGGGDPALEPYAWLDINELVFLQYPPSRWEVFISNRSFRFALASHPVPRPNPCPGITEATCAADACQEPASDANDAGAAEDAPEPIMLTPEHLEVTVDGQTSELDPAERFPQFDGGSARIVAQFGCGIPDFDVTFDLPPIITPRPDHETDGEHPQVNNFSWNVSGSALVQIHVSDRSDSFQCYAPANAGGLTLPAEMASQLGDPNDEVEDQGVVSITVSQTLTGSTGDWSYSISANTNASDSGQISYHPL
ncbi:MAG TPA: hypothetical protein VHM70_21150 [Polyangiaceae bacterium]|nr:hypothetical protein [Polyangiaceae bacterium]